MNNVGRKPKPTALKILEGEPNKDRINQNEPKPEPPSLQFPDWLNEDGRRIWNRYAPVLKRLGVFKQTDEFAFACLCQEAGRYINLQKKIEEKKNYITTNVRQGDKSIPEINMANQCLKQIRGLMGEFGLTPSSRSRISVSDDEEKDPIEKILSSKE